MQGNGLWDMLSSSSGLLHVIDGLPGGIGGRKTVFRVRRIRGYSGQLRTPDRFIGLGLDLWFRHDFGRAVRSNHEFF